MSSDHHHSSAPPSVPVTAAGEGGKGLLPGPGLLADLARGVAEGMEPESLLSPFLDGVLNASNCRHGFVAILDTDTDSLKLVAGSGAWQPFVGSHHEFGRGLIGQASNMNTLWELEDLRAWREGKVDLPVEGVGPVVVHPIQAGEGTLGLLGVGRSRGEATMRASERESLPAWAAVAALALMNNLALDRARREREDRQGIELHFAQQQAEADALLDLVPAAVWVKDADNRILRANPVAAEFFEQPQEALVDQYLWEADPEHAADEYRADLEVLRRGEAVRGSQILRMREDGAHWWEVDRLPRRNQLGEIVGVIVHARDISAEEENRRRQEAGRQEARRTNRNRDRLIGVLRQELRVPSRKLCQALGEGGVITPELHERARHLEEAIRGLLDFARLEAGHLHDQIEDFDIAELLSELVSLLNGRKKDSDAIWLELDPALPPKASADRLRLQLAILRWSALAQRKSEGYPLELRANATAESGGGWRIQLDFHCLDGGNLVDTVERGKGQSIEIDLGLRLMELLGGSIEGHQWNSGSRLRLEFPLSAPIVASPAEEPPLFVAAGQSVGILGEESALAESLIRQLGRMGLRSQVDPLGKRGATAWLRLPGATDPPGGLSAPAINVLEDWSLPLRPAEMALWLDQYFQRATDLEGGEWSGITLVAAGLAADEIPSIGKVGASLFLCSKEEELLSRLSGGTVNLILMDARRDVEELAASISRLRSREAGVGRIPIVGLLAHEDLGAREAALAAGADEVLLSNLTPGAFRRALAPWLHAPEGAGIGS